jgi:hypothetical protein
MYEMWGGGGIKKFSKNNFITKSPRNYKQYTGTQTSSGGFFYVVHRTAMSRILVPVCHK